MERTSNQNNVITAFPPVEETNTASNSEDEIYGTKEVAKFFHCSIPTAREIMRRDDFPLLKLGGKWMVLKSALIKWASEKRI